MTKPALPQGTRDFGPETVRKRNYIFETIRSVFELYGFQPLETPAMENLDTLMGKYGDEGDKLIFKILNNGLNDPKNSDKAKAAFDLALLGKNHKDLTERALRYDLTIPFARYVAMNHGQLTYPFKRYQIQPVWRADRPQKGRYREFYQCDADIVGTVSLLSEVELAGIYASAFRKLKLPVSIKINSRKMLAALRSKNGANRTLVERLVKNPCDGAIKLYITSRGLQLRREERELFVRGFYVPLTADGERGDHAVGFARTYGGRTAVALAGRFFLKLADSQDLPVGDVWKDTAVHLPKKVEHRSFRNVLTGEEIIAEPHEGKAAIPLREAFSTCPVALLMSSEERKSRRHEE